MSAKAIKMQLFSLISSLAIMALSSCVHAASFQSGGLVKITRQDRYIGDFRLFGQTGCFAENLGVWTITQSTLDICYDLDEEVRAIRVSRTIENCGRKLGRPLDSLLCAY